MSQEQLKSKRPDVPMSKVRCSPATSRLSLKPGASPSLRHFAYYLAEVMHRERLFEADFLVLLEKFAGALVNHIASHKNKSGRRLGINRENLLVKLAPVHARHFPIAHGEIVVSLADFAQGGFAI